MRKHSVLEGRLAVARRLLLTLEPGTITWKLLAERTGLGEERLKYELLPGYKEQRKHRKAVCAHARGERGVASTIRHVTDTSKPRDIARRLREIPPDRRSLTGRILGDPIPGRRAIDMEGGE